MTRPDTITATLPLPEPELSPLRQAYNRTALRRLNIPFDQAMATAAMRICLENLAQALAHSTRKHP
jgi:hypothetical protein